MQVTNLQALLLFLATFAITAVLTPIARRFAIARKIYDAPSAAHKTHKEPVPYLGGVAIIAGISIVTFAAWLFASRSAHLFLLMSSVLAPALVLGAVGLIDDLKNLPALPRFVAQTIAGLFISFILIASHTIGTPSGSKFIDYLITTIWVVGICNSINFFDNLDGGAAGTVTVIAIALAILAHGGHQYLITAFAAVIAGACVGFLLYNKSPARIYMGDAGALFLGVMVAALTIRLHPLASSMTISYATPLLLLAVPILDTSVAVTSRLRRKISPFQGGRDHLSHRLIRAGLPRPLAAVALWLLAGAFAFLALLIPRTAPHIEREVIAIALFLWLALYLYFMKQADAEPVALTSPTSN